jgi:hypothetical protein
VSQGADPSGDTPGKKDQVPQQFVGNLNWLFLSLLAEDSKPIHHQSFSEAKGHSWMMLLVGTCFL